MDLRSFLIRLAGTVCYHGTSVTSTKALPQYVDVNIEDSAIVSKAMDDVEAILEQLKAMS